MSECNVLMTSAKYLQGFPPHCYLAETQVKHVAKHMLIEPTHDSTGGPSLHEANSTSKTELQVLREG